MKRHLIRICTVWAAVFGAFTFSIAQESDGFAYEVNRVYPPVSLTLEAFDEVTDLSDLNQYYKRSWIREFHSVEVTTLHNGKRRTAVSANDTLTHEQKDNIVNSDRRTEIEVVVLYTPENSLKHNEPKSFDFKFSIDPERDAEFPGGEESLKKYLERSAIAILPEGSFVDYDLVAITFTVNEEGAIVNPKVATSSEEAEIDALFVDAIQKMPCWTPAQFATGLTASQEYALTVGNMSNCMINTINIRKDKS